MTQEHVELSDKTRQRLERFVEERDEFVFYFDGDVDYVINKALDMIERRENSFDRLEAEADLEREALFDACLVGMQRAMTEEFDMSVSTLKNELLENIRLGAIWTGNNALLPCRNDDPKHYYEWIICKRAKEHNKARRYDNPIFKHFDKWRR